MVAYAYSEEVVYLINVEGIFNQNIKKIPARDANILTPSSLAYRVSPYCYAYVVVVHGFLLTPKV